MQRQWGVDPAQKLHVQPPLELALVVPVPVVVAVVLLDVVLLTEPRVPPAVV